MKDLGTSSKGCSSLVASDFDSPSHCKGFAFEPCYLAHPSLA
jgi:hypothetical protein